MDMGLVICVLSIISVHVILIKFVDIVYDNVKDKHKEMQEDE